MAEGGQTDSNKILPTYSHSPDKSPEWLKERVRMVGYIVDSIMDEMSPEEKDRRARSSVHESLYYLPDTLLVDKYEAVDGPWTDKLEYYRPQTTDCNTTK
tara:strand:- start:674 stop:973 length:300 start_codon:yes stop_codon:yes gene_type:complete